MDKGDNLCPVQQGTDVNLSITDTYHHSSFSFLVAIFIKACMHLQIDDKNSLVSIHYGIYQPIRKRLRHLVTVSCSSLSFGPMYQQAGQECS